MAKNSVLARWALAAIGALTLSGAPATAFAEAREELVARVDSLRALAKYGDALALAREIRSSADADSTAPPYEVGDAHRLVAAMERAAALGKERQEELAAADRAVQEAERAIAVQSKELSMEDLEHAVDVRDAVFGSGSTEAAAARNAMATASLYLGNIGVAEEAFRSTLSCYRSLPEGAHPDAVACMINFATLRHSQGRYAEAEALFRGAMASSSGFGGGRAAYFAMAANGLADVLRAQGNPGAARPLFEEALDGFRELLGDGHPNVVVLMGNLGVVSTDLGDYESAARWQREALTRLRALGPPARYLVGMTQVNLGATLENLGRPAEAEKECREGLEILSAELGPGHRNTVIATIDLARLLLSGGDADRAAARCRSVLESDAAWIAQGHPYTVAVRQLLGECYAAKGATAEAESVLTQAAGEFELTRRWVEQGAARAKTTRSPYPELAAVRLRRGRGEQAWEAAERGLGRTLVDLLQRTGSGPESGEQAARGDSLAAEVERLQQALTTLEKSERAESPEDLSRIERETRSDLQRAWSEWDEHRRSVAKAHPLAEGQPYSLEAIQGHLEANEAILGWLDVRGGDTLDSWGYVIRERGDVRWVPLESPADPAQRAGRLRECFATRTAFARCESEALFSERVEPLVPLLEGVDRLIVIPSAAMRGIPVEALVDEHGSPWIDHFTFSYAPSATVYAWLEAADAPQGEETLLVGDPPYRPEDLGVQLAWEPGTRSLPRSGVIEPERLSRLGGTRIEVEAIADLVPAPLQLVGRDASEQRVVALAAGGDLHRFRVLHFATHAFADDRAPERSGLVLSQVGLPDAVEAAINGERIFDGVITAREILREWDLDADLVVLSACETALGEEVGGEGYLGLAHALFQVGARSLLASLWPVDDAATALLMSRFYESYEGAHGRPSLPKAEALREAKRWLRDLDRKGAVDRLQDLRWSREAAVRGAGGGGGDDDRSGDHPFAKPYYWASFILLGSPD